MRISDLIKMGLRNLGRRKARTALTIIGVIIGTISIVVMVSLGIGLDQSFEKSMMRMGSITTLTIRQNAWHETEDGGEELNQENLMNDDFVQTLKSLEHVKSVSPMYNTSIRLYGNGWVANADVMVADYEALKLQDPPEPTQGTYDFTSGSHNLIFGKESIWWRQRVNSGKEITDPVDFTKEKFSFEFDTIAMLAEEGNMDAGSGNPDAPQPKKPKTKIKKEIVPDFVVIDNPDAWNYHYYIRMDLKHFKEAYERQMKVLKPKQRKQAQKSIERYSEISVIVDNAKNVEAVSEKIREYGAQAQGIGSELQAIKKEARIIELVLGGIGAVSMLVSAISIANTMIMSIYERTKEIGVMKVLGCVVTDIKKLFLLEAGTIGAIGGAIGLGLSYLISYVINHYLAQAFTQSMMGNTEETLALSIIPIWLSILALMFAFLVGVISGYIPARRATKISAIEAMKSDG